MDQPDIWAGGQPIQTEEMRYGLRIKVVVLPAHPLLISESALKVVGPAAFGYTDMYYSPATHHVATSPIPHHSSM